MNIPFPSSTFRVRVTANSDANEVTFSEGVYHVRICEPADKNKANKELVRFLSKTFKRRVAIKRGMKSRDKVMILV